MKRLMRLWHDCNVPAGFYRGGWSCDHCGTYWSPNWQLDGPWTKDPIWTRATPPTRWLWPRRNRSSRRIRRVR